MENSHCNTKWVFNTNLLKTNRLPFFTQDLRNFVLMIHRRWYVLKHLGNTSLSDSLLYVWKCWFLWSNGLGTFRQKVAIVWLSLYTIYNYSLRYKLILLCDVNERNGIKLCFLSGIFPIGSVQFSSVAQSCPTFCDSMNCSMSITNSQSPPKPMSVESVMPSNHLILCRPLLLLLSIFPSITVFSNQSALHTRWPKYWSFIFNISPSNAKLN